MPLEIPNITDPHFRQFVACGRVEASDTAESEQVLEAKERRLIVCAGDSPNERFIRLIVGRTARVPPATHLHVDLAVKNHFTKPPQPNSSLDEIFAEIEKFDGKEASFALWGHYVIPWENLPAEGLIRSTQLTGKLGAVSISQTSSKLKITGSETLREIRWEMEENETDVSISIGLFSKTVIDEAYLSRLYPVVDVSWRRLLLDDKSEESQ